MRRHTHHRWTLRGLLVVRGGVATLLLRWLLLLLLLRGLLLVLCVVKTFFFYILFKQSPSLPGSVGQADPSAWVATHEKKKKKRELINLEIGKF